LEKQQDNLVAEAKQKMLKKDKKGAMFCLKKKKMLQGQIDTIMGTMITMEQQKMALENAAT
jgi:charged multivesicular body protein 4A/B